MRSVRLFDLIHFQGASWQVVAQEGSSLALQNLATRRIRKLPVAELLGDDSYLPDSPDRLPSLDDVAVLETLDGPVRDRTAFLHRQVVELLTGQLPDVNDQDPRPEYAPLLPLKDRIKAKLAELEQVGSPIGERTLKRHIGACRKAGIAGLIDQRKTRQTTSTGRVDPRVVSLLEAAIFAQRNVSTGTRSRVIEHVRRDAQATGLPVPSDATFYRVISNLQADRHPFGNATTRRTQANRPKRTYGRQAPTRPGELVEIDSTPLDLMVIYPDGSAGRVDLTIALDIATRTPCAAILRPVATKSVDAAILLARSLTPLPMQPGWDASLAFSRSILPADMIPDDDQIKANIAAKPVIVPESITIDRGKVFVGTTFMAACERLQISVTKAAPRTPTDKPHIERFFASINAGFTQHLAGYVGPNVVSRGKDPAAEAFWTLPEVQNLLDLWIVATWQNRPHEGLRHPAMPRRDLTPNEMYAALAAVAPSVNVALGRDDYIAMLPVAYRAIQPYGINFEGLHYDNPALHPFRSTKSGLPAPASGKWEVRYDPYRLQSIFVRDHHHGRWIEAEWTLARRALAPFSLDVLRAARRLVERRNCSTPAVDVLAEISRIQTSGATPQERAVSRRDSASTPVVPPAAAAATASAPEDEPPVAATLDRRAARRIDDEE
jgi:putative transposase